jgi:hypothetical protein
VLPEALLYFVAQLAYGRCQEIGAGMINQSLLFATVVLFTATAIERAPAVWRGPPQMVAALDPETRAWVQGLRNKVGGSCCDTADGFPVEVDGWDMAGTVDDTSAMNEWEAGSARSGYRVRLSDRNRTPSSRPICFTSTARPL